MKLIHCLITILAFSFLISCRKSFLDAKPDNALVVPATLTELQALLDNDMYMNGSSLNSGGPNPGLLVAGTDDYFIPGPVFVNLPQYSKNVYTWNKEDSYGGAVRLLDWASPYRAVFYANTVLLGLSRLNPAAEEYNSWNNAKGAALFFRGHAFYQLAQVFAPPYAAATAASQWGIPLKLSADISEKIERASLSQTYDQVLSDLKTAATLLPLSQPVKTRPSKPAAYAMLARVYLAMQNYQTAWLYADSCLQLYNSLLDYNTLPLTSNSPFPKFNKEIIFYTLMQSNPNHFFTPGNARIDTALYASYARDDLRRSLFFRPREPGWFSFKGSYDGSSLLFVGLATDEVYLVRAECYARTGNTQAAMDDLNTLLVTRFKSGTFVPYTAATAHDALVQVLAERRKELLMRGLRWTDLRRLNTEPGFAKTIERVIDGQSLILPPNDDRYTWPLPPDVIGFNPSLPQNPR